MTVPSIVSSAAATVHANQDRKETNEVRPVSAVAQGVLTALHSSTASNERAAR